VYQIQQTEIFAKWLSGLRDVRAKAQSSPASTPCASGTWAMSCLSAAESAKCGLMSGLAILCISLDVNESWSSCYVAATNQDIARAKLIAKAIE
jgi:hypothetical protein